MPRGGAVKQRPEPNSAVSYALQKHVPTLSAVDGNRVSVPKCRQFRQCPADSAANTAVVGNGGKYREMRWAPNMPNVSWSTALSTRPNR
jgi:hypothetical protein